MSINNNDHVNSGTKKRSLTNALIRVIARSLYSLPQFSSRIQERRTEGLITDQQIVQWLLSQAQIVRRTHCNNISTGIVHALVVFLGKGKAFVYTILEPRLHFSKRLQFGKENLEDWHCTR